MYTSEVNTPSAVTPQKDWSTLDNCHVPEFFQDWLSLQCADIADCFCGLLVNKLQGSWQPQAVWPLTEADTGSLTELVDQVIQQKTRLILPLSTIAGDTRQSYGLALPVEQDGELVSVVAFAVRVSDSSALKQVMSTIQRGTVWLRFALREQSQSLTVTHHKQLSDGVDLLAEVMSASDFDSSAMTLLSSLAISCNCELVALGFLEKDRIKVCHLSQSSRFGEKMNLVRRLEAAMTECADQHQRVVFPQLETPASEQFQVALAHTALAHTALAGADGSGQQPAGYTLLTLPLLVDGKAVGALTLQRDGLKPFTEAEADYCESVVSLSVPYLLSSRDNSRSLFRLALHRGHQQLVKLLGKGYPGRKLAVVCSLVLVALLSTVTGEYRLSANASLGTAMKRDVVAPLDGFIASAPVRAGDRVKAGDALVTLDDKDLQLEKLRWKSQLIQLKRELQDALGGSERARVNIISAQIEQAKVQLALVNSQIERTVQRASFDGQVLAGDLSQKLGGAVRQGEVLFELSPLDSWRIQLEVADSRIGDVQIGQQGTLYLSAWPEAPQGFVINRITPLTVSKDGGTFYRVEGELQQSPSADITLRPGMEGVGKIAIDERSLTSIWGRDLVEWLNRQWWIFWG